MTRYQYILKVEEIRVISFYYIIRCISSGNLFSSVLILLVSVQWNNHGSNYNTLVFYIL